MNDPTLYLIMAIAGLAGLAMLSTAALAGWRGWLQLKQQEIGHRGGDYAPAAATASQRIEIADLKERIRKLEAIAAGVDL